MKLMESQREEDGREGLMGGVTANSVSALNSTSSMLLVCHSIGSHVSRVGELFPDEGGVGMLLVGVPTLFTPFISPDVSVS